MTPDDAALARLEAAFPGWDWSIKWQAPQIELSAWKLFPCGVEVAVTAPGITIDAAVDAAIAAAREALASVKEGE